MTNSKKIRIALLERNVTVKELADKIGISIQTLYNKLNNSVEFKGSEISKIAKILKFNAKEVEAIFFADNVD